MNDNEEVLSGWSWTKDQLNVTPMKATLIEHGICVVEVDEKLSRTRPGAIHARSVLRSTQDEVFQQLEDWKADEIARARRSLERAREELVTIRRNRRAAKKKVVI
jgi:hypothetical protein